jgi:hypothetical protein
VMISRLGLLRVVAIRTYGPVLMAGWMVLAPKGQKKRWKFAQDRYSLMNLRVTAWAERNH